jgi:hypothetical protein
MHKYEEKSLLQEIAFLAGLINRYKTLTKSNAIVKANPSANITNPYTHERSKKQKFLYNNTIALRKKPADLRSANSTKPTDSKDPFVYVNPCNFPNNSSRVALLRTRPNSNILTPSPLKRRIQTLKLVLKNGIMYSSSHNGLKLRRMPYSSKGEQLVASSPDSSSLKRASRSESSSLTSSSSSYSSIPSSSSSSSSSSQQSPSSMMLQSSPKSPPIHSALFTLRLNNSTYIINAFRTKLKRIVRGESRIARSSSRKVVTRDGITYLRQTGGRKLIRTTRVPLPKDTGANTTFKWKLSLAKKKQQLCIFFTKFGKCNKMDSCPYLHDKEKVAICRKFLRGKCQDPNCFLSHKIVRDQMPVCYHFLRGQCSNEHCMYAHVKVNPKAAVCPDFLNGYCPRGMQCKLKHTDICQSFYLTGKCDAPAGTICKLRHIRPHRNREDSSQNESTMHLPLQNQNVLSRALLTEINRCNFQIIPKIRPDFNKVLET